MKMDHATPGQEKETRIDWNEIRRRLEMAGEELARGVAPSPEEQRSIFKSRARALAQEPKQAVAAGDSLEVTEFRLASETYAIESAFVREVYPLKDLTPLPGAPPFVLGIVNVRGQILSVVDLKKFFNLPDKGIGDLNKVIILRNDKMEFGILTDAILGMHHVPLDAVQTSPPTITGIGAAYLRGVTGECVIILDTEKILSDEKIIVHEEVAKT